MARLISTNPKARKAVEQAAVLKFGTGRWEAAYEHGQWWIIGLEDGDEIRSFSVVDTSNGLDFEAL
jgi:hypothetical protein